MNVGAIVNSLQVSGTIENVRNVQVNSFQPDNGSYIAFIGTSQLGAHLKHTIECVMLLSYLI